MTRAKRDPFAEVGTAIRRGGEILLAGDFTEADFRVWAVVVNELGSWSRLAETVYRDDIAEQIGRERKSVSRAMAKMHKAGVLTWVPGRKNVASKVMIHPTWEHLVMHRKSAPSETSECPLENRADEQSAGQTDDLSGTSEPSQRDTQMSHPYEESEETEEGESPEWARFMLNPDDPNRAEFGEAFDAIEAEHGADFAAQVLDRVNGRYRWASQFRKAMARQIPTVVAERRERQAAEPPCPRCEGRGVYEETKDRWAQCDHRPISDERRAS